MIEHRFAAGPGSSGPPTGCRSNDRTLPVAVNYAFSQSRTLSERWGWPSEPVIGQEWWSGRNGGWAEMVAGQEWLSGRWSGQIECERICRSFCPRLLPIPSSRVIPAVELRFPRSYVTNVRMNDYSYDQGSLQGRGLLRVSGSEGAVLVSGGENVPSWLRRYPGRRKFPPDPIVSDDGDCRHVRRPRFFSMRSCCTHPRSPSFCAASTAS